jgi:hypothetical protein
MKMKAVVFYKNTAKILTNPSNLEQLAKMENVLINPDLALVEKEPPHFWKRVGDSIHPMSRPEKIERLKTIDLEGMDDESQLPESLVVYNIQPEKKKMNVWVYVAMIEAISLFIIGVQQWIL